MTTIRHHIAALCLLLCACILPTAQAQTARPLRDCVPIAQPQGASLQVGMHIAFVCTNAAGVAPYPAGLSCLHSMCNPAAFAESVLRVAAAPDRAKAIDAEWAANIKWNCDAPPNDPARALCAERRAWIAANWAAWTKGQP